MQISLPSQNCSQMEANTSQMEGLKQNLQITKEVNIQNIFLNNQQKQNQENQPQKITQLRLESKMEDMYIEPDDPQFAQKIQCIKLNQFVQIPVIAATIILLGSIAGVIVGNKLQAFGLLPSCVILGYSYYLYLVIATRHNNFSHYMSNLKTFDHYQLHFRTATSNPGYIKLMLNCSYVPVCRCFKSNRVLHQAVQKCYPVTSQDLSQGIQNVEGSNKFVFVRFYKRFCFADSTSRRAYLKNSKQIIQKYSHNEQKQQMHLQFFQIDGFQQGQFGFSASGSRCCHKILFFFLAIFGLALPYSLLFQRFVDRYEIKIVKRLEYGKQSQQKLLQT